MKLFDDGERRIAEALAKLTHANPFLPERIEHEREVLGGGFVPGRVVWNVDADLDGMNPNLARLETTARELLAAARERIVGGRKPSAEEAALYENVVLYFVYARYEREWRATLDRDAERTRPVAAWESFAEEIERDLALPGFPKPDAAFLFAYGYQTRRAFHFVFRHLYGASLPAARLRAAVWQSIFSRDRRRYRRALVGHMHDVPTLITGPSGTGKELVARAIGCSQFIPFDAEAKAFAHAPEKRFFALNLSALTPTLIESELFGHRRGAARRSSGRPAQLRRRDRAPPVRRARGRRRGARSARLDRGQPAARLRVARQRARARAMRAQRRDSRRLHAHRARGASRRRAGERPSRRARGGARARQHRRRRAALALRDARLLASRLVRGDRAPNRARSQNC
jgi:hypothetical protein